MESKMDSKKRKAIEIMRWRYNMDCFFTDQEISDEIAMLKRKDEKGRAIMNGTITYFCFVAVLLAVLAVKYGWLVVELYQNFNALLGGM